MKGLQNYVIVFLVGCLIFLSSCSIQIDDDEKLRDIEFTVVDPRKLPEELSRQIEEEKQEPFCLTFSDEGWLYLARGYGQKDTSGYSVEVTDCYETTNLVCLRTRLNGPSRKEELTEEPTWPYVVVKMEYCDKNVFFE